MIKTMNKETSGFMKKCILVHIVDTTLTIRALWSLDWLYNNICKYNYYLH